MMRLISHPDLCFDVWMSCDVRSDATRIIFIIYYGELETRLGVSKLSNLICFIKIGLWIRYNKVSNRGILHN